MKVLLVFIVLMLLGCSEKYIESLPKTSDKDDSKNSIVAASISEESNEEIIKSIKRTGYDIKISDLENRDEILEIKREIEYYEKNRLELCDFFGEYKSEGTIKEIEDNLLIVYGELINTTTKYSEQYQMYFKKNYYENIVVSLVYGDDLANEAVIASIEINGENPNLNLKKLLGMSVEEYYKIYGKSVLDTDYYVSLDCSLLEPWGGVQARGFFKDGLIYGFDCSVYEIIVPAT